MNHICKSSKLFISSKIRVWTFMDTDAIYNYMHNFVIIIKQFWLINQIIL